MPEMAAVCNGKQGENAVFPLCFPQQPAERFASVVVHAEKPSPALCVRGTACCSALRFGLFLLALNTSGRYLQRISRTDPKATFSDADSATLLKPRSDSFFHCLRTSLSLHKSKGKKERTFPVSLPFARVFTKKSFTAALFVRCLSSVRRVDAGFYACAAKFACTVHDRRVKSVFVFFEK